jgi:hypothetical protein
MREMQGHDQFGVVLMPLCPNCGDWPDGCLCKLEDDEE